jgi:hypothetical protein
LVVVVAGAVAGKNGLMGAPPEIAAVCLCMRNYAPIPLIPEL